MNRWLRQARQSPLGGKSFVCEVEGEIASNVSIEFKELHLGEGVYIKTGGIAGVCTDSEHRRKGIMQNLMQKSLAYIKNTGTSNSALFTSLEFPAHRIYLRCGFGDVQTWPVYAKIPDIPAFFRIWLRGLNWHLKHSKIAQKTLQNWNRSVILELEKVGTQAFRFKRNRFQRLSKPPKSADIVIVMDVETLTRMWWWGAINFKDAMKTGKMQVKKGGEADLKMLRKIVTRIWDE